MLLEVQARELLIPSHVHSHFAIIPLPPVLIDVHTANSATRSSGRTLVSKWEYDRRMRPVMRPVVDSGSGFLLAPIDLEAVQH